MKMWGILYIRRRLHEDLKTNKECDHKRADHNGLNGEFFGGKAVT